MPEQNIPKLSGASETLLIPLYVRAREALRADAILRDDQAAGIVRRIDYDFSKLRLSTHDETAILMREREFDRQVREFLERHPDGIVVHIGCGLDARFERVDNGKVEWYDLDIAPVIELRCELMEESSPRHHILAFSVFEEAWLDEISRRGPRPILFLAEGIFPYFEEQQVRSLVLRLRERFPGSDLLLDAMTPFMIRADNMHLALTGMEARLHWGLKKARDLERWGAGIVLMKEWYYFDIPEPRLGGFQWVFRILGKSIGVFYYRLGQD